MLGDNIRRLRLEHEMSQAEFASVLYVSQGAVSQWEQGRTTPDTNQLLGISRAFHVSMDQLMKDEPIPSFREIARVPFPPPLTPTEEDIVLDYRNLDDKGQKKLREYLDDLLLFCRKQEN